MGVGRGTPRKSDRQPALLGTTRLGLSNVTVLPARLSWYAPLLVDGGCMRQPATLHVMSLTLNALLVGCSP